MQARRFVGGLSVVAALCVLGWVGDVTAQEPAYGSAAAEIAERIAAAFPKVTGQVIGLERERVLLDLGTKDAVIPGLELQIYREGQEFKHPYTGQILGKLDRDVGRVRILEVQPNFCVAEVIQQAEGTMVQQGDKARVTTARIIVALPNVDVSDVAGANTRSVTRDLVNALVKSNRFEVMPDQRIRAALAEEKLTTTDSLADPAVLQVLWKRLRVTAVLLGKLSVLEKSVRWDVQVLSTVRGDTITLAGAEVKGAAPRAASAAPARGGGNFAGQDAPRIDQIALRAQELPYKGVAMTTGEFTGDGTIKLAVTDGQGVFIYDVDKNGVKLVTQVPGLTSDNVIALDAADINGNGVAEIFVTNYTANAELRSYVLEYQNGKYVKIWQDVKLYFRVMEGPAGGPLLYGQTAGDAKPFAGPVRRYAWQGGRYAAGDVLPLPKAFPNLYGFTLADVDGDGAPEILILDGQDYLRVFDRSGSEVFRSSDHYGGSDLALEYQPEQSGSQARTETRAALAPTRLVLQGRMYFQDIMGNGKKQVVLPRNTPSTGYMFHTRLYDKGKVFGIAWDGMGMQPVWETREVPGYIADFALMDPDGSGNRKLALLVVQTNLIGMSTSRTTVVLLDLKPQG
jgi:hypothetical protein